MERERKREKERKLLFIECVMYIRDYFRCFFIYIFEFL